MSGLFDKVYSGVNRLPRGRASEQVTEGCLVLEGGAFRGVYTSGVLDALMEADLNFQCTVGVSAGAMNGMNYVAGQIGRSGRINLMYRRDRRYVGVRNALRSGGIIGFDFVLHDPEGIPPFDWDTFNRPERRFIAVAANCLTGGTEYFEKGRCGDILKAVQASASMPYVSRPVTVDGIPCLDGGCTAKIPIQWALDQDFKSIVVVRTRPDGYRKKVSSRSVRMARRFYGRYPAFVEALSESDRMYNLLCDKLQRLQKEGRIFVLSPSAPVSVRRLERDMEALGALYRLGYDDANRRLTELRRYLLR